MLSAPARLPAATHEARQAEQTEDRRAARIGPAGAHLATAVVGRSRAASIAVARFGAVARAGGAGRSVRRRTAGRGRRTAVVHRGAARDTGAAGADAPAPGRCAA